MLSCDETSVNGQKKKMEMAQIQLDFSSKTASKLLKEGSFGKARMIFNEDTFKIKLSSSKGGYIVKLKGDDRILSAKELLLRKGVASFAKISKMQDYAAENDLLHLNISSAKLAVNGNILDSSFVLMEMPSKRVLERDSRKEGVIFYWNEDGIKILNEDLFGAGYNEWLQDYISDITSNKNLNVKSFLDEVSLKKYLKVSKQLSNLWYINPNSLELEPIINYEEGSFKWFSESEVFEGGLNNGNMRPLFSVDNLSGLNFILKDEPNNKYTITKGKHKIDEAIFFDYGYDIEIEAGASLDLINGAHLVINGALIAKGEKNDKIKIFSSDKSSQGIAVFAEGKHSTLSHVHFNHLRHPEYTFWQASGSVLFFKGEVDLAHVKFEKDLAGDDYLNIVRGKFQMNDCEFLNTFSDAFDGDFVEGDIRNIKMKGIGNDGLDFSGSEVYIEQGNFRNISDKAISGGEESELICKNIKIQKAEIGVASKDASKVVLDVLKCSNNSIDLASFQKKNDFSGAEIDVQSYSSENAKHKYLVEENSHIRVEELEMKSNSDKVEDLLYGEEYGKASK